MPRMPMDEATALVRTLMSDKRFNKILDEIEEKERRDIEGEERVFPYVLIYFREKNDTPDVNLRTAVMAIQPELIEKKYEVMGQIGRTAYENEFDILAAFMMSEAWASEDSNHEGPPSEDPNRIEVIIIHGMAIDRRVNMRGIRVTRDDQGKMSLGETIMKSDY